MSASETAPTPPKISVEFAARLQRLGPDDPIRVIVLADGVAPYVMGGQGTEEMTRAQRRAVNAVAMRAATRQALQAVDAALAGGAGRRLTERPNALGHIVVETTRTGVEALCRLACVRTVLEDQSIHPHLPVARSE